MNNNLWVLFRLFVFIGIFSFNIPFAFASSKEKAVKEGNELYSKELYDKAAEKYNDALSKDSESDIINFNLGTALYKQGDYPKSIGHLQKALLSDDNELKKNAYFNLGNSFYKEGMSKEQSDLKYAIQSLESSIAQYEKIINIDKDDKNNKDNNDNKDYKDAKFNYDYVSKELKRLKLKLEQQEKQQQKQQQKQDQSKKDQGSEKKENKADNTQGSKAEQSKEGQKKESQSQGSQGKQEEQTSDKKQSGREQPEENKTGQKKSEEEQASEDKKSRQQSSAGKKEEGQGNKEKQNINQGNTGEMTKEEAEMILRKYQQTEEPEGLLKFNKHYSESQGVVKDW